MPVDYLEQSVFPLPIRPPSSYLPVRLLPVPNLLILRCFSVVVNLSGNSNQFSQIFTFKSSELLELPLNIWGCSVDKSQVDCHLVLRSLRQIGEQSSRGSKTIS